MDYQESSSIWSELRGAGLFSIALVAAAVAVIYGIVLLWGFGSKLPLAGQFGDSFGALTSLFNALAFSAVVATVVLQSRELRATRLELARQAEAQREWAAAARDQLKHAAEVEDRKLLPVINCEWDRGDSYIQLYVSNVGFGLAIIESIDVFIKGVQGCSLPTADGDDQAAWESAIGAALNGMTLKDFQVEPLTNLNRTVQSGASRRPVLLKFSGPSDSALAFRDLHKNVSLVIRFKSLTGKLYSTSEQFEAHQGAGGDNDSLPINRPADLFTS